MAAFRAPSDRRSTYDPNGDVQVELVNDLSLKVSLAWIDYGGSPVQYGELAAGARWNQSSNSEHPWLISGPDQQELACVCFTSSCSLTLSAVLNGLTAAREVKLGYLASGGDFASGLTAAEAERVCLANPGKTMGYCYQLADPDCCWVKVPGTGFAENPDWRTVTFGPTQASGQLRKRQQNKRHNVFEVKPQTEQQCIWRECGDRVCCTAMDKVYHPIEVEGLRFFVEENVLEKYPRMRDQINGDMAEISRLLPPAALGLLREKTAVWINDVLQYPDATQPQSGAWCHWSRHYPEGRGDLPEKGGCVEVCQAKHYLDWVSSQPAMLLHELSHAYHCHNQAAVDGIIEVAYKTAMASGLYDTAELCGTAKSVKPYCAGNKEEFFAESSEAFFSSRRFCNDYFPYVHAELKGFDPVAYKMCEDAWGIRGDSMPSRGEVPQRWVDQLAKVDSARASSLFEEADTDSSGCLDAQQFSAMVSKLVPGINHEEARSMLQFSDTDRDGRINYTEFMLWLTQQQGAYHKGMQG